MTLYEQETRFRREVIQRALTDCGGCREAAARALGINRTYLQRIMRQLGLQDYRQRPGRLEMRG